EPPFNSAQQILETGEGQLWFVQQYGGEALAVYEPGSDTWKSIEAPGSTQAVALSPDNSLWLGTNDDLWHVTAEGTKQRFSTADGLPGNNITALAFGGDGGLWIETETGLAYHHPDDDTPWRDFTDFIPSPHVTTLYTDPHGQTWIGVGATEGHPAGVAQAGD